MSDRTQLLGISNAIVDILAHIDDSFLEEIGAPRGSMILIDADQASELYAKMGPTTEMSGGSVGNSVAGFANLGGRAAYIGRVADDQFGAVFNHDMISLGIDMRLKPETRQAPTATSYVLISPDGQRTMQTFLGACGELAVSDVNETTVGTPQLMLIEGYLFDTPEGPQSVKRAIELAQPSGTRVALSLSDDQCVLRHHDAFRDLIGNDVKIVVANETEIVTLLDATNFDQAVERAQGIGAIFALTRSENGSVVVSGDNIHVEPAVSIKKLVDTTGAGDAYTAGFLYGVAEKLALSECAALGSRCAADVIQQVGARFQKI